MNIHTGKMRRACHLLDPILMMALAGGPMNVIPPLANCSAKFAFSLRKPYLKWNHWYSRNDNKSMNSTRDVQPAEKMSIFTLVDGVYAPGHHSDGIPR